MINKLKAQLDLRPDLQKYLFIRGFLITTEDISDISSFPFYGNWNKEKVDNYYFMIHNLLNVYYYDINGITFFLIGHAYNPFTMEYEENIILKKIAEEHFNGTDSYYKAINELTGIFILGYVQGNNIQFLLDCSGMQYACYGIVENHTYIASHICLIEDICVLGKDPYVQKLINYRWYRFMMGNYLPGDLTPYPLMKRIIPNTIVGVHNNKITVKRFYPNEKLSMCTTQEECKKVIIQGAEIMKNNMLLIAKKWKHPAISLTGGIDSNTTFAAANGLYEKYSTFSYVSMFRESVDADAAKKISDAFGVKHLLYEIPDKNETIKDFDLYKLILNHNDGEIGPQKDNDVRKKIILMQNCQIDVEVKSWISETIRAYAYKYFGRKKMPKNLSPRNYTSLYKIFFFNRKLVWKTDFFFKQYIEKTNLKKQLFNYDESDFFVWEMMHGGKCGLNIGTMKFCFDITIPYNNRNLLNLLLQIPLNDRINDKLHMDMKKYLNQDLYDMNIRVVNLNETKFRKNLANIYFSINSSLPF